MESNEAVVALAALAQESRLNVFRLLVKEGPEGLRAGQIAENLEIPPATLSFHLKELSHAGLVESRREGRFIIYAPNISGIRCLMGFLLDDCCQGRPELCAPGDCGDTKTDCSTKKSSGTRQRRARKAAAKNAGILAKQRAQRH